MKIQMLTALACLAGSALAFADPAPTVTTCPSGMDGFASTTQGQTTIGGKSISYTARTGLLEVTVNPNDFAGISMGAGNVPGATATAPFSGCFFYTSYTVATAPGAPARPVTFAFNGGPGSASLWLHMGLFGPERVVTGPDGLTVPIPFQLEQNADSMLDLTDVVMIDPIGTGFSQPLPGTNQQAFFGAIDDAESVATFIRNYLVTNNREESPFYIAGESYGGVRGSLVSDIIQEAYAYPVKGVVFISPCFSSTTYDFSSDDNPIPYVTFLPSMAEIATYHGAVTDTKLASLSTEALFLAAHDWAMGPYLEALMAGDSISPTDSLYAEALSGLADFTGISTADLGPAGMDLRMEDNDFFSEVVPGQQVGRFDGRYIGPHLHDQTGMSGGDPSATIPAMAYTPAFDWYVRNTLGVQTTASYTGLANIQYWPMDSDSTAFVATHNLSQAFVDNPKLNVFVANGYYDMACPMGTSEYERSQLDRKSNGAERMELHRYPAGHMVYTNPVALHALKADLTAFYAK